MLRRFGHDWLGPPPEPDRHWPGEVRRTIASQGYEDGHWLFKTGAFYWKTWAPFKPIFVKVWREPDAIQRSYRRCGFLDGFTGHELSQLIARQHQAMGQIAGPDVMADQVAGGQAQAFLPAVEALGLPFDKAIFEAFVNRDLWTK